LFRSIFWEANIEIRIDLPAFIRRHLEDDTALPPDAVSPSDDVNSREPLALFPELCGCRVISGGRIGHPFTTLVKVRPAHTFGVG
jgi:hypothetical protein